MTGVIKDFDVTPDGDLVRAMAITDAGVARDLSSTTINVIVRDGDTSESKLATYAQTITNAAGGLFTFKIPKTLFADRAGGELYYQLIITADGNDITYMSGALNVAEAL